MRLLGILHAGDRPAIFNALNPVHAVGFLASHGFGALPVMGSVFLAVTGAEALYADMGHFGRGPIRTAWLGLVFPALALNYLGQGSLVLARPETVANPFFLMAPGWGLLPLVLLATAATIIASQAVISGAFSLTRQAVQLGLLPRLEIQHTSETLFGQVYMPRVNWMLLAAVLVLVVSFRSSGALASAYGIAVTGTMVVTSLLAFTVFRRGWKWPLWAVLAVLVPLLAIELVFLGANLAKLHDGGYVPLIIAGIVGTLMTTWVRGTSIVNAKARAASVSLGSLIGMLKKSRPGPRARHRGLPHLRPGRSAGGADAQPQAQPRAARAQRHRHRHRGDDAAGCRRPAHRPRAAGRRLLADAAHLRLHGDAERAEGAGAGAARRADLRDDEHVLLPEPPLVPDHREARRCPPGGPGSSSR